MLECVKNKINYLQKCNIFKKIFFGVNKKEMKIRVLFALFSSLNKIICVFKLLFTLEKIKIKYLINEKKLWKYF